MSTRRPRGTGSVYLPTKDSAIYWCQYFLNGARQRESTGFTNKRKAEIYLQSKLAEVSGGNSLGAAAQHITVEEIVMDVICKNRNDGNDSVEWDDRRWNLHLKPTFGRLKAGQVTTAFIDSYIAKRKRQEMVRTYKTKAGETREVRTGKYPGNGTINRELALLRSAFWLAHEATPRKVAWVPTFHMLDESGNVRKGFLKDEEYGRLADECGKVGLWLRAMFEIYYTYGWRRNEPIETLKVRLADFTHRTITIEDSKNGEGRIVVMTQKVFELVKACCEGKRGDDPVFTRNDGKPVRDFRASWRNACVAALVPNLKVHDLRRTGARNLRRAGVDRDIIMRIGGWKTDSVFKRYNIIDEADLRDAVVKLEISQKENSQRIAKENAKTEVATTQSESAAIQPNSSKPAIIN
jgi:integrase